MSLDSKDEPEELEEGESTPAEIAEACREILDPIDPTACDEIAAHERVGDAWMNAMFALMGLANIEKTLRRI
ncbi:MAG: hypothetical protein AAB606_03595 [Patescibacteria group bacterium]